MTSKAFGLAQLGNAYADGALSNRNVIINGAMQVAQRGTSGTSGFLLDRWNGNGTSAQSQSSDAPAGFTNSFEFTLGIAGFANAMQRIERANSAHLAGNNVTVSFWAKNLSGSSNIFVEIYRAGSNDNFGSLSLEGFVEVASSPSLSWTYYTATFALSASATTGLELRIGRNNVEPASTRLTGVQLEAGDTATPFEHRSYGAELALCQRYYQDVNYGGLWYTTSTGVFVDMEDVGMGGPQFFVPMRATPTVFITADGGLTQSIRSWGGESLRALSGIYVHRFGIAGVQHGGGYTVGRPYTGTWKASAEL